MNVVCFRYSGKFGHFLRAEANANGITYPVPPRTVLLGLVGSVLGLGKDEPQTKLADACLAIGGVLPKRFWHKTNIRKDPPAPLPYKIKASDKGTSSEQRNFRFPQEYLWKPDFRVWAALSAEYHSQFVRRLKERQLALHALSWVVRVAGRFGMARRVLGRTTPARNSQD